MAIYQIPYANNIVGWWRSGRPTVTGRYNASMANGTSLVAGPQWGNKEYGWNFDGTNDYVLVNNGPILIRNAEWTIAAVVKASAGGERAIYCERGSSGNDILKLEFNNPGELRVTYRDDAGFLLQYATVGEVYADNTWRTVMATRRGTSITLAVDGRQRTLSTIWSGSDTFTDTVESRIGGDIADSSATFNGSIAEVILLNKGFHYGTDPYLLDESPFRYLTRLTTGVVRSLKLPRYLPFGYVAPASSFQSAWARGSNVILQPGVLT